MDFKKVFYSEYKNHVSLVEYSCLVKILFSAARQNLLQISVNLFEILKHL